MRHSKSSPEVNAGSMADIAFLLLMFFLVTSAIPKDKGFNRKLPGECPPHVDCTKDIGDRNVMRIVINNHDAIMVDNEVVSIYELKDMTKKFVDNNGDGSCDYCHGERSSTSSDNPKSAVLSLQADKQTSYNQFIAVQDELTKAYYELRNTYSNTMLKKASNDLTDEEVIKVKQAYPFILSETEMK
ncbi:ExbD/TolR family protein [Confluentibacter sediminis]|uniref:ExbD/TolR family protein n=1 Tax=Confluentibacter sediminis TaxID=2219045 RepID=UPI000DACC679|nr:biopolymer transporter ExbD [Confluentibacter sediminis]